MLRQPALAVRIRSAPCHLHEQTAATLAVLDGFNIAKYFK
jgi:hypothetical protein